MAKCQVCGRGPQYGHNVSHSMVQTNRRWNVNVQRRNIVLKGKPTKVAICTQCLKTMSKAR